MTSLADTLQVVQGVIVSCDDVIYLGRLDLAPREGQSTSFRVGQDYPGDLTPVVRGPVTSVRVLPRHRGLTSQTSPYRAHVLTS